VFLCVFSVLFCDLFRVESKTQSQHPDKMASAKERQLEEKNQNILFGMIRSNPQNNCCFECGQKVRTTTTAKKKTMLTMVVLTKIGAQHGVHRLCDLHLHHLCGRAVRMLFFPSSPCPSLRFWGRLCRRCRAGPKKEEVADSETRKSRVQPQDQRDLDVTLHQRGDDQDATGWQRGEHHSRKRSPCFVV